MDYPRDTRKRKPLSTSQEQGNRKRKEEGILGKEKGLTFEEIESLNENPEKASVLLFP